MRTNQAVQAERQCYETYSYHITAIYSALHTYVSYVMINAVLIIPMDGLPSYMSWLNFTSVHWLFLLVLYQMGITNLNETRLFKHSKNTWNMSDLLAVYHASASQIQNN